jgi:hypothetical protein
MITSIIKTGKGTLDRYIHIIQKYCETNIDKDIFQTLEIEVDNFCDNSLKIFYEFTKEINHYSEHTEIHINFSGKIPYIKIHN